MDKRIMELESQNKQLRDLLSHKSIIDTPESIVLGETLFDHMMNDMIAELEKNIEVWKKRLTNANTALSLITGGLSHPMHLERQKETNPWLRNLVCERNEFMRNIKRLKECGHGNFKDIPPFKFTHTGESDVLLTEKQMKRILEHERIKEIIEDLNPDRFVNV